MAIPIILVMIMLHYLPRFSRRRPGLSSSIADITGQQPGLLTDFLVRENVEFRGRG